MEVTGGEAATCSFAATERHFKSEKLSKEVRAFR
jgi:hypothetical protein